MKISKKDFQAYEKVRLSGKTNMFDLGMVRQLAEKMCNRWITAEKIIKIMQNYNDLKEKYAE